MKMRAQKLTNFIKKIKHVNVLVVGDLMLDVYEWCKVTRLSPEAPVPIAVKENESTYLGGAANVAHNVRALGANVTLVGVVGRDIEGKSMLQLFDDIGIERDGVLVDAKRSTTIKRRIMAGTQQICRIDKEDKITISVGLQRKLLSQIKNKLKTTDVLILSDYLKGVFSEYMISSIMKMAEETGTRVFVDSKDRHLMKFKGAYLIKPNKEEAEHMAGERFSPHYENLEVVGERLVRAFQSRILITLGGDGMALFDDNVFYHHTAVTEQQVFDVSGAGDTVLAVLATTHAVHHDLRLSVDMASVAASHVVGRLGIAVCEINELKKYFAH
jgi:D-beta-D-heptose 7-phosphate kinase/D-beta-D-heptose 1-phosphate adenosyltransferase